MDIGIVVIEVWCIKYDSKKSCLFQKIKWYIILNDDTILIYIQYFGQKFCVFILL